MNMTFWLAYKMLFGNLKRAIFPFMGVLGGIAALIISLSLGAGGEKLISSNLMAIGNNRIVLGGDELGRRDIQILENYPFVEYVFFPEARRQTGDNIFRGYSKRSLLALGLNANIGDREVIIDKSQFPDKKIGDNLEISIDGRRQVFIVAGLYEEENPFELMRQGNRIIVSQDYFERLFGDNLEISIDGRRQVFIVAGLYEEENPFELMRQGNRIIVSQDYFERLFGIYRFNQIVVSFYPDENSEDLIPIVLNKFNLDRRGYKDIKLLETPEVYKRILKIQKIVKNSLGILAFVSLCLGGFGIMNLIAGGVRARTVHIGILRAMGMSKDDVVKLFLTEGIIIAIAGTICGIIFGIIGSFITGKIIIIPPVFKILKILFYLIISLIFGIGIGIFPARRAGEMSVIDALREN